MTVVTTSKATKVAAEETAVDGVYEGYKLPVGGNDAYQQFCEEYASDLQYRTGNDDDAFGRPANNWWNGKTEVGTYAKAADYIYSGKVTKGTLYSDYGKSNIDNLKKEDGTTLTVYVDGKNVFPTAGELDADAVEVYFKSGSSATIGAKEDDVWGETGAGAKTEMFINDDNDVTIVIINEYVVKAAADYNAKTEEVTVEVPDGAATPGDTTWTADDQYDNTYSSLKLSADDFAVTDVKEKDYLIVTAAYDDNDENYDIKSVTPAEKLTGSVSTYIGEKSVTIDGTTYTYAVTVGADSAGATNSHGKGAGYTVGEDAAIIVDANNNIIYVDSAVSNSNWVFIGNVAADTKLSTTYIAEAVFADGTAKTITIKDVKVGANTYDDLLQNIDAAEENAVTKGWYTYTTTSDGKYKLTQKAVTHTETAQLGENVGISAVEGGTLIANGVVSIKGVANANNSTTFVIRTGNSTYDVYKGISAVPTIAVKALATENDDETPYDDTTSGRQLTAYYRTSSGYATHVYVDARSAKTTSGNADKSELVYLIGNGTKGGVRDADGNVFYTFAAIVDGTETTINVAEDAEVQGNPDLTDDAAVGGLLYFNAKKDSDGYINSLDIAAGAKSRVAEKAEDPEGKEILGGLNVANEPAEDGSDLDGVKVKYSGGVLTFVQVTDDEEGDTLDTIVTDGGTKVYLVVSKSAATLIGDTGVDYELTETTASGLKTALAGYLVNGAKYDVVYNSDTSSTAAEIYFTVGAATKQ